MFYMSAFSVETGRQTTPSFVGGVVHKSQIPLRYLVRASFEPAPNQLRTNYRNGIWLQQTVSVRTTRRSDAGAARRRP